MSYPQASASGEVLQGSEFFRLFTRLTSAGDIYEMDVSAKAFVIGPQSDISRVRVTSWDPELPGSVQSFIVSVDDPFLGRVDNFGSQKYPTANTPARILISPEDFFAFWQPSTLAQDIVARVNPTIDLLAYLAPPAATPARRSDFVQKGRLEIAAGGNNVTTLIYPYFRRKYASVQFTNFPGLAGYTVDVTGITYTPDGVTPAAVDAAKVQLTPIVVAGAVPAVAGATVSFEVRASLFGLFDALMVEFHGLPINAVANTPYYTVRFTDEEI
jgi:hypothetical protein